MNTFIYPNTPPVRSLFRGVQIIWYVLGVLEVLLVFRFALKLFGANPNAGFTHFIYQITYPIMAPFLNVFHVQAAQGSVVEWTALVAIFVYWLLAWMLVRLLVLVRPVSVFEANSKLDENDF